MSALPTGIVYASLQLGTGFPEVPASWDQSTEVQARLRAKVILKSGLLAGLVSVTEANRAAAGHLPGKIAFGSFDILDLGGNVFALAGLAATQHDEAFRSAHEALSRLPHTDTPTPIPLGAVVLGVFASPHLPWMQGIVKVANAGQPCVATLQSITVDGLGYEEVTA